MKFIKDNMKVIVAVVITVFITSGVVGATVYQYQASDIKYGNTTVGAAVGDLYTTVNASSDSYGLKVDQLLYSDASNNSKSYTCPSGKTCIAFTQRSRRTCTSSTCYYDRVRIGSAYSDLCNSYIGGSSGAGYTVMEVHPCQNTYFIPSGITITMDYTGDTSKSYGYMMVYSLK